MVATVFASAAALLLSGHAPAESRQLPSAQPPTEQVTLISADAEPRWTRRICPGVIGLSNEHARYLADRIGQRASELNVRTDEPGCDANVLIIFSSDPDEQARRILSERTDPASATQRSGNSRGIDALREEFLNSDAPVRWRHVTWSLTDRGFNATRNERQAEPPRVDVSEVGRLRQPTFESISHVIIIVDRNQVNGLSLATLGDYLAMVALTDPPPSAAAGQSSILNLFTDRAVGRTPASQLTSWDEGRLRSVY